MKVMVLSAFPDERLEMVIQESEKLNYELVFCDENFHENAEGITSAYYVVNWNDTDNLLKIAHEEKIDGVIGICDKAMIPVSKVAQAMNLPGNSPESVELLLSKYDFREFQQKLGVFCPKHFVTGNEEEILQKIGDLKFPVIVKPLLCSSSFGQTVLKDLTNVSTAFSDSSKYSRNGKVCVEEYIENKSLRGIEMDLFVLNDNIIWDGIRYSYRVEQAPLRPIYDVYPVNLTADEYQELRNTVSKVLKGSCVKIGEYNVEGFFNENGQFFILEINPRQAGYYNPQHIQMYCGVNLTKLLLQTAVNDMSYYEFLKTFPRTRKFILSYSVFSDDAGILEEIYIDPSLKSKVIAQQFFHGQKIGDKVLGILDAFRPVCNVVLEFSSMDELENASKNITKYIHAVVK